MKKSHLCLSNLLRFHHRPITNSSPLCASERRKGSSSSNRLGLYCTPAINSVDSEKINSAVGLQIGLTHISWARIETKTNLLTHLDFVTLPPDMNKMELHQIYSEAVKTIENLPSGDCYVMESLPRIISSSSGKLQLTIQATRVQLISMLVALLNSSSSTSDSSEHSGESRLPVMFMKPRVTAKLFNLLVGSEIIASHEVVSKLLTKSDLAPFSSVNCSVDILKRYDQVQPVDKEILGQAFLITVAFIEMMCHKNQGCYKLLLDNTKKNQ